MIRIADRTHKVNRLAKPVLLAMALYCIACLAVGNALAEWRTPAMADYVKVPPFISFAVKPNIMIMLDNSGSMNELAYAGAYAGVPYNGYTTYAFSFPVAEPTDDMEEYLNPSYMKDGSSSAYDLDLGVDYCAVRFRNLGIPQGAEILEAHIQFTAKSNSSDASNLVIEAEASDDAPELDLTQATNISSRPATGTSVSWTPAAWTAGYQYDTPDIKDLVQDIVDRPGWTTGETDAMLFRIKGIDFASLTPTGWREAYMQDQSSGAYAPILWVTYRVENPETRYYGYFNPDYFYDNTTKNTFNPKYKKVSYNTGAGTWNVVSLSGVASTLTDANFTSEGLWDGNWLNWVSMRRVDVLRKVLMGGKATSRTGGGNQHNLGEDGDYYRTKSFSSIAGKMISPYLGPKNYVINKGNITVGTTAFTLDVQKYVALEPQEFFEGNLAGVLQRIGDRARWGNMWFNTGTGSKLSGAFVQNTIANGFGVNFLPGLQNQACDTWTPLAESMYVASQYFAQQDVASGLDYPTGAVPHSNIGDDPYYDADEKEYVACAKSFVLLLTDGASTKDSKLPSNLMDFDGDGKDNKSCNESTGANCDYDSGGTDYLDDVALYARTTDLRADLEGDQNVYLYTVYAFSNDANARSLLMDASRNGGFEDLNGDGKPNGTYASSPEDRVEWDKDGDDVPDTYFEASDGYTLEAQLLAAINAILARASSGTAASAISNSRSGEGAIYQSIFYPATTVGADTAKWVGQVHALFVDAHGNMREDTNQNQQLDLAEDYFISFAGDVVQKYVDSDGDGIFDPEEGPDPTKSDPNVADPVFEGGLTDIRYLWNSNNWLNELTDAVDQRTYASSERKRYIITFVDADGDMVADEGEVKDFTALSDPSWGEMIDPSNYFAYIYTFDPYNPPIAATDPDFQSVVLRQARRVVNYTRGQDQPFETIGAVNLVNTRNRKIDYDRDGVRETWRMGDIVHSTPLLAPQPSEELDLIYRDQSFRAFAKRYVHRRNVLYASSNDGMVHAFNGGFFDDRTNKYVTQPVDIISGEVITAGGPYTDFELGAELWAYIPFNELPHLYWRTTLGYEHIYGVDLEPRVFDAKAFPNNTDEESDHPYGWGTILVAGMRFGGGKIAADIDKSDGAYNSSVDKAMSSSYAILDITNPEVAPKVLAEITFPELGYTTCDVTAFMMRGFDKDGNWDNDLTNKWYLAFGSGPISPDSSAVNGANTTALTDGTSSQQAVLYLLDLTELATNGKVVMYTPSGAKTYTAAAASDPYYLVRLPESKSSISKPVAVDWNLDYMADTLYFGESFGDHTSGWNGKLRRVVMETASDRLNPATWVTNSTLLDLTDGISKNLVNGQPIMAPPSPAVDSYHNGNRWLFFGTGRYYSLADKLNTDQQSYYGIKETYTEDATTHEKTFTYGQVGFDDLLDVTDIEVYNTGTSISGYSDFGALVTDIDDNYDGWRMDLDNAQGERNLGKAVLAGELLTFTTYTPSTDLCSIGGESQLYATFYRTGTAYVRPTLGLDYNNIANEQPMVLKRVSLGAGMTITPNIHVGRQSGAMVFTQSSTGTIEQLDEASPGKIKSGRAPSSVEADECAEAAGAAAEAADSPEE